MSLQKRAHWTETIDGVLYDEDVDVYTSASAVLYEDGTSLEDNVSNYATSEQIGDLDTLTTTDKSSLASAIEEVQGLNDSHVESVENASGGSNVFWLENDNALEWVNTSVSTLPYDFYGRAVIYNGEIHILGSSTSNTTAYKYHYKYNGSTWESVSTLPDTFWYAYAVVYQNQIHMLGGTNRDSTLPMYKFNGSSWEEVSSLPYMSSSNDAVVLDNELHVLGGYANSSNQKHYKWNGEVWEDVSTTPYSLFNSRVVVLDNEIHLLGGSTSTYHYTYHYKWNGSSWSSASTLPYNFYSGSAVVLNGEIHIMGTGASSTYYKYHYRYNGSSWTSVSTLPYNFYYGSTVVLNGEIHIMGGTGVPTNHYSLNTPNTISGYCKQNCTIYLPTPSTPITDNLTPTDEGYLVTDSGYVEIAVG